MAPDAGNGGSEPKLTPPPPPSPSLGSHGQNPPSPQQSPRSTPHPPPVSTNANNSLPPPNSPSHRPQGSSPSNSYPPPPDVGVSSISKFLPLHCYFFYCCPRTLMHNHPTPTATCNKNSEIEAISRVIVSTYSSQNHPGNHYNNDKKKCFKCQYYTS